MKRAAYVLAIIVGTCLGSACPQPLPPTPPPTPGDIFTAKVFDCRLPVVAVERDSCRPSVRACLLDTAPTECLVQFAAEYNPASIACVARDEGASANANVLAGSADPADKTMADATRRFILDHAMGYR